MSGSHPSKHKLEDAEVYIHIKDGETANVTHIDVEHPDLNEVIRPDENSYTGGKEGGLFIGLKKDMIERAEKFVEKE